MPRVKITDLPVLEDLDAEQAKGIFGGFGISKAIKGIAGIIGKRPGSVGSIGSIITGPISGGGVPGKGILSKIPKFPWR